MKKKKPCSTVSLKLLCSHENICIILTLNFSLVYFLKGITFIKDEIFKKHNSTYLVKNVSPTPSTQALSSVIITITYVLSPFGQFKMS